MIQAGRMSHILGFRWQHTTSTYEKSILVIYCSVTNHFKLNGFKQQQLFILLRNLNFGKIFLKGNDTLLHVKQADRAKRLTLKAAQSQEREMHACLFPESPDRLACWGPSFILHMGLSMRFSFQYGSLFPKMIVLRHRKRKLPVFSYLFLLKKDQFYH